MLLPPGFINPTYLQLGLKAAELIHSEEEASGLKIPMIKRISELLAIFPPFEPSSTPIVYIFNCRRQQKTFPNSGQVIVSNIL